MTSKLTTDEKGHMGRVRVYYTLGVMGVDDFTRYCLTGIHPLLERGERVGVLDRVERIEGPIERYLIKKLAG